MLWPFVLYRISLAIVLSSIAMAILSLRYRKASKSSFYLFMREKDLPEINFPYSSSFKNHKNAGMVLFYDLYSSFLNNWFNLENCGIYCRAQFVKKLIELGLLVKNNQGKYKLDASFSSWQYDIRILLKLFGFLLADSLQLKFHLGVDFDEAIFEKLFETNVEVANRLLEGYIPPRCQGLDDLKYKSSHGYGDVAVSYGEFKIAEFGDSYSNRVSEVDLERELEKCTQGTEESLYHFLRIGRQKQFTDYNIRNLLKNDKNLAHKCWVYASATEPYSTHKWLKYGFQGNQKAIKECLSGISLGKRKKLFQKITGFDEMPYGGATRVPKFDVYSNYYGSEGIDYNIGSIAFEYDVCRFLLELIKE